MSLRTRRFPWLPAAMLLLATAAVRAQEAGGAAVLLHDESGGAVAVEAGQTLRITGFAGSILLRTGKAGELRYESRSREDRSVARPVGLWSRAGALELAPLPGSTSDPLWIEIGVPPGLAVELDLEGCAVEIPGLRSHLVVGGKALHLAARGIYGNVRVDADDSEIGIDGVDGDVRVDGAGLRLSVKNVSSYLSVGLARSQAQVFDVRGDADLELEDTDLVARDFQQTLRLSAVGGSVEIKNSRRDTDLKLVDTPLVLSQAQGRLAIDSNGDVRFDAVQAITTVSGFGASVQGTGSQGSMTIATSRATVSLEQHTGKLRVEGDGLTVELRAVKGEVSVATNSSQVRIEKVEGPIEVINDFGDVHVEGTREAVRIVNLNGSVFASGIGGPFDARVRGERVEVEFGAIGGEGQRSIRNEEGDVVARLPATAQCRVEVESSYGRVHSDLPTVRVSDDQRFASGVLGSANQPLIDIHSAGDVLVTGSGGNTEPEPNPTQ